jgi:hypothetical protein
MIATKGARSWPWLDTRLAVVPLLPDELEPVERIAGPDKS